MKPADPKPTWELFEGGQHIGSMTEEGRVVVYDEEHADGARITIERCKDETFCITCSIYRALFFVTIPYATAEEARASYAIMREEIGQAVEMLEKKGLPEDESHALLADWANNFIEKHTSSHTVKEA